MNEIPSQMPPYFSTAARAHRGATVPPRPESEGSPVASSADEHMEAAAGQNSAARTDARSPEILSTLQALLTPLFAENARLVDQIRELATEVGRLQERMRQLEATPPVSGAAPAEAAQVRALRTLLVALGPDA